MKIANMTRPRLRYKITSLLKNILHATEDMELDAKNVFFLSIAHTQVLQHLCFINIHYYFKKVALKWF